MLGDPGDYVQESLGPPGPKPLRVSKQSSRAFGLECQKVSKAFEVGGE